MEGSSGTLTKDDGTVRIEVNEHDTICRVWGDLQSTRQQLVDRASAVLKERWGGIPERVEMNYDLFGQFVEIRVAS